MKELIDLLRKNDPLKLSVVSEAADALEAQAKRIAELESEVQDLDELAKESMTLLDDVNYKGRYPEGIKVLLTRIAELEAQIALVAKQRPVVWMQSDHLNKFERMACGASMMLARCSFQQAQSDFKPLYAAPVPSDRDGERYRWLRNKSRGMSQIWCAIDDECNPTHWELKCADELDAAIDAAMEGK